MRILVIEAESKIAYFIRRSLLEERHSVDIIPDGREIPTGFDPGLYDLVILDLTVPKISGQTVCSLIRKKSPVIPILVLTVKDDLADKTVALDDGADDYLDKPFSYSRLIAKIYALIKRGKKTDNQLLQFDNLILNPATHAARRGNKNILLSAREYALLDYFMHHVNTVLTKTHLLEHIWDYEFKGSSNIVETYIKYIRQKLNSGGQDKELIHTLRGSGYIMK